MKNVVQDLTSAGLDWAREKWKFGVGSKFIRQGEKNAVKYADEIIVLSKGVAKLNKMAEMRSGKKLDMALPSDYLTVYLHFAEERSAVYCNYAMCCRTSNVL